MMNEKQYQCPYCMREYTFDEWINMLDTIAVNPDKASLGKTRMCECGHRFFVDMPRHQTYYEFTHHITAFHWLFNKLSLGRYCKPVQVDGMVSAVHLNMNHGFGGKPIYWEVIVFVDADRELSDYPDDSPLLFGKRLTSYCEKRNYTMELIEADHKEYVDQLKAGKYLIEYELWKSKGKLYRAGWRFNLRDEHKRYFHNVQITDDQKLGWKTDATVPEENP